MKIIKFILFTTLPLISIMGCSLFETKLPDPVKALDRVPTPPPRALKQEDVPLDLDRLQLEMGVERSAEALGFFQKKVNPCDYHLPGASGTVCGKMNMTWIHFRILCRSSDGTVESVNSFEYRPLDGAEVTYIIGRWRGTLRTDEEGFGQIRILSKYSLRNKRLILKSNKNALGLVGGSVKKIIVPNSWCANR